MPQRAQMTKLISFQLSMHSGGLLSAQELRSSPLLIHVPGPLYYSPTTCSHYTKVWHRAYPIGDARQAF